MRTLTGLGAAARPSFRREFQPWEGRPEPSIALVFSNSRTRLCAVSHTAEHSDSGSV